MQKAQTLNCRLHTDCEWKESCSLPPCGPQLVLIRKAGSHLQHTHPFLPVSRTNTSDVFPVKTLRVFITLTGGELIVCFKIV